MVQRELAVRSEDPQVFISTSKACRDLDVNATPTERLNAEETRECIDKITSMKGALIDCARALRVQKAATEIQQIRVNSEDGITEDCVTDCKHSGVPFNQLMLNVVCGHIVCRDKCLNRLADDDVCPVEGCEAPVTEVYQATSEEVSHLVNENSADSSEKTLSITGIIQSLSPTDQVLVFCQVEETAKKLCDSLQESGIPSVHADKKSPIAPQIMTNFRKAPVGSLEWRQVLIVDPMDDIAAGHNLQNVAAVIFVAPLATETRSEFEQAYTQSIGRAARFGQKRAVKVYHPVAVKTCEVNILERGWSCRFGLRGGQLVKLTERELSLETEDLSSRVYSLRNKEFLDT